MATCKACSVTALLAVAYFGLIISGTPRNTNPSDANVRLLAMMFVGANTWR